VRIRDLRPEDYDHLCELWNKAGLPYRPRGRDQRESIIREIGEGCSIFLVAEEDGEVVGVVLGTHDGRKGWINRLAVCPVYRGRGIGRALVVEVEKRLLGKGIDIVSCLIEDSNLDSMACFARLWYVPHRDIIYLSKRRSPDT